MDRSSPDTIVLAGGQGTRLRSLVSDRPKPMAAVEGRPFLEWLLLALRAKGLRRVILATGYRGEMIAAYFGDGARLGLDLMTVPEPAPLGTGGAIRHVLSCIVTDRVLVINGDSLCSFDLGRLSGLHQRLQAQATLWLLPVGDCRRYGSVDTAGDGHVIAFHEKSRRRRASWINGGVYLFERHVVAAIPDGPAVSLESDVLPALVGHGLCAVRGNGPFLDIGTPEAYRGAAAFISENRCLWDGAL